MTEESDRRPNHLQGQTSPYLLQHLYNPVDWFPWGDEALARARNEERPIFLSIGYAACHWCHVMERESFEDAATAAYLNEHFVCIKVDREERPDLDEIYMNAVQLMTQSGGWPLNVFLTAQLEPFFGGTYFPPAARHGLIGFPDLLRRIQELWETRRDDVVQAAARMREQLERIAAAEIDERPDTPVGREDATQAVAELARRFDGRWGGFGGAPKFPPDGSIDLLLREHARSPDPNLLGMASRTLEAMALGGMYDQIGGGFCRYSVDERWLVPHFEKMLYNQALLVPRYLDAWLVTQRPLFGRIADETLDFVRREMTAPEGGFYSSLDADSEGEEGRFYVWTPDEIREALGEEDGRWVAALFGITAAGNFEGKSIANLLGGALDEQARREGTTETQMLARLDPLRRRLLEIRERRVRPGLDDKILGAWNGLMISAFARGHQVRAREADLVSARRAAEFVLAALLRDGRLRASYREGRAHLNGYLDDHAFVARGLLDLYEACFDERYLRASAALAGTLLEQFEDPERGGFFFTSRDHERLLTRNRSLHDGALPSGAGVATEVLLRLGLHLDDDRMRAAARRTLAGYRPHVQRMPSAYAALLAAADFESGPVQELAVVGPPADPRGVELLAAARRAYRPRLAVAAGPADAAGAGSSGGSALLAGKTEHEGRPTAYVCRDYACRRPTGDPAELVELLDAAT